MKKTILLVIGFVLGFGLVLLGTAIATAQGSTTDAERSRAQVKRPGGISTYFAWRQPDQRTWLVIVTYEGDDTRHDTATLVNPDRQHDICIDYPRFEGSDGNNPVERVCKSAAEVAVFLQTAK